MEMFFKRDVLNLLCGDCNEDCASPDVIDERRSCAEMKYSHAR